MSLSDEPDDFAASFSFFFASDLTRGRNTSKIVGRLFGLAVPEILFILKLIFMVQKKKTNRELLID